MATPSQTIVNPNFSCPQQKKAKAGKAGKKGKGPPKKGGPKDGKGGKPTAGGPGRRGAAPTRRAGRPKAASADDDEDLTVASVDGTLVHQRLTSG